MEDTDKDKNKKFLIKQKLKFEDKYSKFKEVMKYKKDNSKERLHNSKESLIKKWKSIKEIQENKNISKKIVLQGISALYLISTSFLIYKGPIKKKYNISLFTAFGLPLVVLFTLNIAVRSYLNHYYFKSIVNSVKVDDSSRDK